MINLRLLTLIYIHVYVGNRGVYIYIPEIETFIKTDGHGQIDSPIDYDQNIHILYMVGNGSFYLLYTNESIIAFYSTSNGYKKIILRVN